MTFRDAESIFEDVDGGLDLDPLLHQKQLDIKYDPSVFRAVIGGRRSGKTRFVACEALEVADQFPGLWIPYIATTVGTARDIIMPELQKLQREQDLQLTYHLSEHKIFTPNGGCIKLCGLATEAEVEKDLAPKETT